MKINDANSKIAMDKFNMCQQLIQNTMKLANRKS